MGNRGARQTLNEGLRALLVTIIHLHSLSYTALLLCLGSSPVGGAGETGLANQSNPASRAQSSKSFGRCVVPPSPPAGGSANLPLEDRSLLLLLLGDCVQLSEPEDDLFVDLHRHQHPRILRQAPFLFKSSLGNLQCSTERTFRIV